MIIIFLSNYQRDTEKNIQGVKSNYVLMTKNKFVNIYSEDCKLYVMPTMQMRTVMFVRNLCANIKYRSTPEYQHIKIVLDQGYGKEMNFISLIFSPIQTSIFQE